MIEIQSSRYPVSVTGTNVPPASDVQYVLVEMEGTHEGASHTLSSGGVVQINNKSVKELKLTTVTTVPLAFHLEQNYPNPFNPKTEIRLEIGEGGLVTLKVFDVLGREVATLVNENLPPGRYTREFNATGLASGVYLCRLMAGGKSEIKRMVLVR
jgi:hypothetical protein